MRPNARNEPRHAALVESFFSTATVANPFGGDFVFDIGAFLDAISALVWLSTAGAQPRAARERRTWALMSSAARLLQRLLDRTRLDVLNECDTKHCRRKKFADPRSA
jgi:hypothetical protein